MSLKGTINEMKETSTNPSSIYTIASWDMNNKLVVPNVQSLDPKININKMKETNTEASWRRIDV